MKLDARILSKILSNKELKLTERLILFYLYKQSVLQNSEKINTHARKIADEMGISITRTHKCIQYLTDKGYIAVEKLIHPEKNFIINFEMFS